MPTASTVSSINIDQPLLPSNLPMALCPRGAREKFKKHQIYGGGFALDFLGGGGYHNFKTFPTFIF
jgi:hypothetical protein